MIRQFIKKTARRCQGEEGNVTIETALWVPLFVVLLSLMTDGALIFYGQARAMQVAQDGNRAYSIGQFDTTDATETYIEQRLASLSPNAEAQTSSYRGLITTVVKVPTGDLDAIGFFSALTSIDMYVAAQMVQEN